MSHKVLITGSTGMVGKGVLYECLENSEISVVYTLNRSCLNLNHPKLKEILLKDFEDIESIKNQIEKIDACFHCMGISSIGLTEEQFSKPTFGYTKKLADLMYDLNPECVFTYVSGTGTDSSENSKTMWARVKGKTENYILNKGFDAAYMFRPGIILPEKGIKSKTGWYNTFYVLFRPLFPLFRLSSNVTTTTVIGQAMIACLLKKPQKNYLENRDINALVK